MVWQNPKKGLSQLDSLGTAVTILGALMLVFGGWLYHWNLTLATSNAERLPAARYREIALPAAFGLAVLVSGIWLRLTAGHRRWGRIAPAGRATREELDE